MEATFTHIYQANVWGNPESRSGPGSTVARTVPVREALAAFVRELGVRTLLDAPCGDFNWMKAAALPLARYIGADVVPQIIAENRRRHAAPGRTFLALDLTTDPLPPADLVFCRDCLVHFSLADAARAIANFRRSGSAYLLTTTFSAWPANADIATGDWRPLNLQRPPFNFPPPRAVRSDGCTQPGYTDKALALWRLSDLPFAAPRLTQRPACQAGQVPQRRPGQAIAQPQRG